jgi:hypothetical protein
LAQTAAHQIDQFNPECAGVPWVLSLPIPLPLILVSRPQRLTLALQVSTV